MSEIDNHLDLLSRLVRQLNYQLVRPINESPEQPLTDQTIDRCIGLLTILKNVSNRGRVLAELLARHGLVASPVPESPDSAWVIVSHPSHMLSRLEALRIRDLFSADGLTMFHVAYGVNNRVSWRPDDIDIEQAFRSRYGSQYRLWISSTFIHVVKTNADQPEQTQASAQSLYNELVDNFPQVTWQVAYGPNYTLRIKDYVSGQREMRLGVDMPKDATPEQQVAWLKGIYNYDNDDWEQDPGPPPQDTNN